MSQITKRKKPIKPQRYRIVAYGPNEWCIVDLFHNNILAKCAFHQDAQEVVWHLEAQKEG